DDLYSAPYGRGLLNNLTGTPQYLSWLALKVRPHVGDEILEMYAGIGNITGRLMGRRMLYIAADRDPLHVHALRNRFLRTPNVSVHLINPEVADGWGDLQNSVDTVLCIDLLEDVADPDAVLDRLDGTLKPGGRMIVLVPNLPSAYGTLDKSLGHHRRFDKSSLAQLLHAHGYAVERMESFNKGALLPWWAYSRVFGAGSISKLVLKIFDKSVWLLRRLDAVIPWPGISLMAVARKPATPTGSDSARQPEAARNAN
ncbi:MAG TPA: methyltransferase domain-containing protein, partial [Candidatus Acidoferrum sp.]|nr:methyltransferase domain-containing protein [Candidatus Acidoferrum sp.]